MDKVYCIYIHVNKINGKIYIGQTCQNLPELRWRNGAGYKTQKRFFDDIEKYGWDNFEHKILFQNLSAEEADLKEEEMIKQYNSSNPEKGYNTCEKNYSKYHFSELWRDPEIREKMIQNLTEQRNTEQYHNEQSNRMKEIWKSQDYQQKQRDTWTEERKRQASERSKKNWQDENYREYISAIQSEYKKEQWKDPNYRKKICKQVKCLETDEIFNSVKEAAIFARVKPNTISTALKSKTHRAGCHPDTKEPLHWIYYIAKEGGDVSCEQAEEKLK